MRGRGGSRGPRVRKSTGELEPFDERKLRRALRRSGASRAVVDRVVERVTGRLHDAITTRQLYRIAHDALRKAPRPAAARFDLQRAVRRLGPGGYPFERFIGALFAGKGYRARVGVRLNGQLVRHEIDVVAEQGDRRELAEVKFRNEPAGKVDVKIALYVHARSLDLRPVGHARFWLVTNGRFTVDALRYGHGVGLGMLSWHEPAGDTLEDWIDATASHPLTCLSGLHAAEKARLLHDGAVLCRELHDHPRLLDGLGLGAARRRRVLAEIEELGHRRREP